MPPFTIDGPHLGTAALCEPILRALPDWFGIESALVQYVKDVEVMPTFLARAGVQVVGFFTVNRHFDRAAELHVLAVLPAWHRRGVGRALLGRVEPWLAADGCEFLQVKTLSPSRRDEHYDRTREFYLAVGFRPLEEFRTLWGEANPCLQMIKTIGSP